MRAVLGGVSGGGVCMAAPFPGPAPPGARGGSGVAAGSDWRRREGSGAGAGPDWRGGAGRGGRRRCRCRCRCRAERSGPSMAAGAAGRRDPEPGPAGEKRILCVGLVCLDIISVVEAYPAEDSDTRCVSQRWQRGGNASNSCTVLALLGAPCAFMGSLAPGLAADFVLADLRRYGVDVGLAVPQAGGSLPASVVIASASRGTRTILHAHGAASGSRTIVLYDTNLPEVTARDFERVDLSQYKWIHWEARNAAEQAAMMRRVERHNRARPPAEWVRTSVEVEKPRAELLPLMGLGHVVRGGAGAGPGGGAGRGRGSGAGVGDPGPGHRGVQGRGAGAGLEQAGPVFISKDVAQHFGYRSAPEALQGLRSRVQPGATLICAWAEAGADAVGPGGELVHSDAFPPETLVDTLGAGDTFNAAVIFALSAGRSLQDALTFGCQIAGRKCGIQGFDGIV
ncbi:hypothetical protein QYF61_023046 [Mycteria americana]|uniref:Carbohydrate kinase PfkB domain-containing protein n=1 Tax=Mycteria americana TaxID=33587 RepID=A0AAN7NH24_MYCAM|nr:hypothetical protein QYF61_023046 [Mycteria americana]